MRISRVYIESELVEGEHIAFDQDRQHYLRNVLRLKPGASVELFNGEDGMDYRATLTLDGKRLGAHIESRAEKTTESSLDTTIVQGLGRNDHMDWMIQKTTELGVSRIALFNAERTQRPLKASQIEKKLRHWRGVAISACEQCGRARIPPISFHGSLAQAIGSADASLRLLLDFDGKPIIDRLRADPAPVALLLGPEGGLGADEIRQAMATGYEPVRLGSRVLRTETAATSALAITQSLLGDLG